MKADQVKRAPAVPQAKQGAEAPWAEGVVWTDRMISALVNGVRGGRWFSLIDKVFAPKTLAVAWEKVRVNGGASGVDGESVERFEARRHHGSTRSTERGGLRKKTTLSP